jgi:uncharacterized RDD family membrane protein YckC
MAEERRVEAWVGDGLSVDFRPAGPGSRLMAWILDQMVLMLVLLVIMSILLGLIVSDARTHKFLMREDGEGVAVFAVIALIYLVIGFITVLYYGLQESLFGGQTLGKRAMGLRVVDTDGLPASVGAIWIRSLFRIVDHIPLAWLVPAVSENSRRLGDLVAGTVVIVAAPEELSQTRRRLSQPGPWEPRFLRDGSKLRVLKPEDFSNIEKVLDRLESLPLHVQERILREVCETVCRRLDIPLPSQGQARELLEEILRWEYRKRSRRLG